MSNSMTSPSSRRAMRAASSPPMLPAPMREIFLRDICSPWRLPRKRSPSAGELCSPERAWRVWEPAQGSHLDDVRDEGIAERGAGDLFRAFHQAGEVIRHGLLRDGLLDGGDRAR